MTALPAPIPKSDFLPRKAVLLAALFAFCAVASGADPVAPVVWDVAALAPPLEIVARGCEVEIQALNARGAALVRMLDPVLRNHPASGRLDQSRF